MRKNNSIDAEERTGSVASYEICMTLSGSVDGKWRFNARDFVRKLRPLERCMSSHVGSYAFSWDAPFECISLCIAPALMADLGAARAQEKTLKLFNQRGPHDRNIGYLLKMLQADILAGSPYGSNFGQRLGMALVVYLLERCIVFEHMQPTPPNRLPGKALQKVIGYIDERIANPISIEELANHIQVSRFYFGRLFRNSIGQTPGQYILDRRMERAKALLEKGLSNMQEVARESGFVSQSHFASVFHIRNGVTPSHYQRMFQ